MNRDPSAEKYLQKIPMWTRKKNSLKDIRAYLEKLGNPDRSMKLIHVAGTNGKGSVCAFLTSILLEAGYHTGTFTSPHLVEVRERIALDGTPVSPGLLTESFEKIRDLSRLMMEEGYCHPSYFEFLFYMAMEIFSREAPDFVILETGLGGRLDTTNVIERPLAAVITSISLDHMEYLGNTILQIAGEKAGIIKPGIPVVFDSNDPSAAAVIKEKAESAGAFCYPVNRENFQIFGSKSGCTLAEFTLTDGSREKFRIPSVAEYQAMNALLAVRAVEVIREAGSCSVSLDEIRRGVEHMRWPGRMEEALPGVYLDGAHNEGGVRAFAHTAAGLCREKGKKAWLVFAAVSGKEYEKMIREICSEIPLTEVVVTCIDSERGLDSRKLSEQFRAFGSCRVTEIGHAEEAARYALSHKTEDELLFCVGSLYLIGELKAALRRKTYD